MDKSVIFNDHTSVIQVLEQHAISTEQFFPCGEEGSASPAIYCLMATKEKEDVSCLGEEGIDSGALARELFADNISQIGKTLFPGGAPVDSTLYVRNETFKTAGEIVAASLAPKWATSQLP